MLIVNAGGRATARRGTLMQRGHALLVLFNGNMGARANHVITGNEDRNFELREETKLILGFGLGSQFWLSIIEIQLLPVFTLIHDLHC